MAAVIIVAIADGIMSMTVVTVLVLRVFVASFIHRLLNFSQCSESFLAKQLQMNDRHGVCVWLLRPRSANENPLKRKAVRRPCFRLVAIPFVNIVVGNVCEGPRLGGP